MLRRAVRPKRLLCCCFVALAIASELAVQAEQVQAQDTARGEENQLRTEDHNTSALDTRKPQNVFIPEVLMQASFGFSEVEWNGLSAPNNRVQLEQRETKAPTAEWGRSLSGRVISPRYAVGPPPSDNVSGCYVDGVVDSQMDFTEGKLTYRVNEHSHSHYSHCGVNIHKWSTFCNVTMYIRGHTGTDYKLTLSARGSEGLSGNDSSFNYAVDGNVISKIYPTRDSESIVAFGKSTDEVEYQGIVYSKAATLNIKGGHGFGYSNVIFCPHIPWHTSLVVDLNVEAELEACCPAEAEPLTWCAENNANRWLCREPLNRCYNYALNLQTSDWKQPGGGVSAATCEAVGEAAQRDGLTPAASASCPAGECLVALFVWEGVDFHWKRRNRDGTWSEKHGGLGLTVTGAPARGIGVTVNNQPAPDSWIYDFCSYYCVPCDVVGDSQRQPRQFDEVDPNGVHVTFNIYSGLLDPSWTIKDPEAIAILKALIQQTQQQVRLAADDINVAEDALNISAFDLQFGSSLEDFPGRLSLARGVVYIEKEDAAEVYEDTDNVMHTFLLRLTIEAGLIDDLDIDCLGDTDADGVIDCLDACPFDDLNTDDPECCRDIDAPAFEAPTSDASADDAPGPPGLQGEGFCGAGMSMAAMVLLCLLMFDRLRFYLRNNE